MKLEEWKKRIAGRNDVTTYVSHLTKPGLDDNGNKVKGSDVLLKIIEEQKLIGSTTISGFISGDNSAVCFQDAPFMSLAQNVYYEQSKSKANEKYKRKYYGYGFAFPKDYIYKRGGRPVIYDDREEAKSYLPKDEWWRIVNYNLTRKDRIIDWTHEREWRIKGDFKFELRHAFVVMPNHKAIKKFAKIYEEKFSSDVYEDFAGFIILSTLIH